MKAAIYSSILLCAFAVPLWASFLFEKSFHAPVEGRLVVAVRRTNAVFNGSNFSAAPKDLVWILKSDSFWNSYAAPRLREIGLSPEAVRPQVKITVEPRIPYDVRNIRLRVQLSRGGDEALTALTKGFSDYCLTATREQFDKQAEVINQLRVIVAKEPNRPDIRGLVERLKLLEREYSDLTSRAESFGFPQLDSSEIILPRKGWH